MRYVIIDLDGASRGHFAGFSEVLHVLDQVRRDDGDLVDELYVLRYDDDGQRLGSPIAAITLVPRDAAEVADVTGSSGVAEPAPREQFSIA